MILYFADRKMDILGAASTSLSSGLMVINDEKDEVIGDSVNVFEAKLSYEEEDRKRAESYTAEGNYVLCERKGKSEIYTIISTEQSVSGRTIEIYCEDAGLDLLNETAWAYTATEAHGIAWYINKFSEDSGFEIGINEVPTLTRKLSWDGTSTVAERLASIAARFDNAEISYSFEAKNMKLTKKYINIYKKRGADNGLTFQHGQDISDITVTRSIENLATALEPTGGTPDGEENPITLSGYTYDDGDIYISGKRLISRSATQKWSRYRYKDEPNQITGWLGPIINREWTYDTTSQSELCSRAVSHLKDIMEPEVNYEVEFVDFPDNVSIGDTIYICDHAGEKYLSARVLELKSSEVSGRCVATLGDYLIATSGVSDKIQSLATQFAEFAAKRQLYTWIVYADDAKGTGITTEADGKSYMGVSANHTKKEPDLSDPLAYTWSMVKGEKGEDGADGKQGPQGEAGVSPTVTTSKSGGTTTIKITDASGTKTATVSDGADGVSPTVVSTATKYQQATSGTAVPTGAWSSTPPTATAGQYMWTQTTQTFSDKKVSTSYTVAYNGTNGTNGANGTNGKDGKGVKKIQEQYYLSTSSTSQTGGTWSNTMPTWSNGKYIWKRDYITYTDNSTDTSAASLANALNSASSNAASAVSAANSASATAAAAQSDIDGILTEGAKTVDGSKITDETITADKIVAGAITADKIDVNNLFAQDISATGSITGATLRATDSAGNETLEISSDGKIIMGTDAGIYLDKGDTAQPLISWSKSTTGEANVDIHNSDQMTIEVDNAESGIYFNIAGEDVGYILADGLYMDCHGPANRLGNYFSRRPASANITTENSSGELYQFKATASMTEGKPATDGHILHFEWDTTGGWDTQLALSNQGKCAQLRGMNGSGWNEWEFLPTANFACMRLKQVSGNVKLSNTYGSAGLKWVSYTYDISSFGFSTVTAVMPSVVTTSGLVGVQVKSFSKTSVSVYVWGDTANASVYMTINLLVIGQM